MAGPGRPTGSTGRGRVALHRPAVLRAAVDLADREGLDAVSMRRLAHELDVVPMALYKHVADKEDLLDGMVAVVIGEFGSPAAAGDPTGPPAHWKAAVREGVLAARHTVLAHPWARRAIESRSLRTPAVLGHMEAVTREFLRGGLSPDLTHHAMHALGNRIWGFSPELFTGAPAAGRGPRAGPAPDPADYPGILAIATDAAQRRPGASGCDEDFEFGFALDLILDAVERLHEARWTSPPAGARAVGTRRVDPR